MALEHVYTLGLKRRFDSRICMNTPSCHSKHSRYDIGRLFLCFFSLLFIFGVCGGMVFFHLCFSPFCLFLSLSCVYRGYTCSRL